MSKTTRLQILVSPALDARIREAAQRSRMSKGEWARQAIERQLEAPLETGNPVSKLAGLGAPTGDVEQMLAEIAAGRS